MPGRPVSSQPSSQVRLTSRRAPGCRESGPARRSRCTSSRSPGVMARPRSCAAPQAQQSVQHMQPAPADAAGVVPGLVRPVRQGGGQHRAGQHHQPDHLQHSGKIETPTPRQTPADCRAPVPTYTPKPRYVSVSTNAATVAPIKACLRGTWRLG